jgi:hypothetical protein
VLKAFGLSTLSVEIFALALETSKAKNQLYRIGVLHTFGDCFWECLPDSNWAFSPPPGVQ